MDSKNNKQLILRVFSCTVLFFLINTYLVSCGGNDGHSDPFSIYADNQNKKSDNETYEEKTYESEPKNDAAITYDSDITNDHNESPDSDNNVIYLDVDRNTGQNEECAEVSETATLVNAPADIIIAVDNSGSMTKEASMVQENLNNFLNKILDQDVDARITLISIGGDDKNGICIEAPLGSPNACPDGNDSNPPLYRHIFEKVNSHDALNKFLSTYIIWKPRLRANGKTHFIVVSDDNSAMAGVGFELSLAALGINDFIFHSIVSEMTKEQGEKLGHPCGEFSADEGTVYKMLSNRHSGVIGDLCSQEFEPIFTEIANGVVELSFSCSWQIPSPPDDEEFDKNKVNLDFTDDNGTVHEILYVEKRMNCLSLKANEQGWYYDNADNPTMIKVCDKTCNWMKSNQQAQINIKFGCKTKILD